MAELLLCQELNALSDGVNVSDRTIIGHIRRVSTRLYRRRNLANTNRSGKIPSLKDVFTKLGKAVRRHQNGSSEVALA